MCRNNLNYSQQFFAQGNGTHVFTVAIVDLALSHVTNPW